MHAIREQDAPPDIKQIYGEIMQLLGVPQVNVIFQVYASYAGFLPLQWNMLRPVIQSGEFFQIADRLRADAYTRAHNYFEIVGFRERLQEHGLTEGAQRELSDVIDLFVYTDPVLLLIAAAQQQAFDGAIGTGQAPVLLPQPGSFTRRPVLVDEETAEAPVRKVFDEIKQTFGMPVVSHDFRALARWPDFLSAYWDLLQPLLTSPLYQQCQYGINESAWNLARELPGNLEMTIEQMTEAGMNEDDIASVVRLTQAFTKGLSGSVLNISIAKVGIDGGNQVEPGSLDLAESPTPDRAA